MNEVTRRTLIAGGTGAAVMLALGGVAKYAFGDTPVLRPPGGQDEKHFIATCIKCDRCRGVCPLNCISVANMNDGLLNARTPKLDYHLGYCDFCDLCIQCCPTGALKDFDPDKEWVAPAVIDRELCIAYQPMGGGCMKCIDGCPYDAITTDTQGRPVVELDKCNGCGYCEYICPSNSYRVFSGIRKRAITVEADRGPRIAGSQQAQAGGAS
ncbi:MAG: 4Fe-4S dicluster domain-containing protein [Coriobacteriia bacterium]|nr:4Fe-4S dicluster domain-containing protein [Coriobacteriia bacterium]